jgi:hypothetical protein
MGAALETYLSSSHTESEVSREFESYQEDLCRDRGNDTYAGHLGIKPGLEFVDGQCKNRAEAEEYILNNNQKWEAAMAVSFPSKGPTPSAKGRALLASIEKIRADYEGFSAKILRRIQDAKSKNIGCKACGSSVSRRHLGSCDCPVCGTRQAFLTNTDKKRLENLHLTLLAKKRKKVDMKEGKRLSYLIGGWCAE